MSDAFPVSGLIPLHILYHAVEGKIYGQAMMDELRRHRYQIGPGTMYPMSNSLLGSEFECYGAREKR